LAHFSFSIIGETCIAIIMGGILDSIARKDVGGMCKGSSLNEAS